MHPTTNSFVVLIFFVLFVNPKNMRLLLSSSETKLFDLRSLPHSHLTFLGDSHLRYDAIVLTKEDMQADAPRSAGVALYNHPILLLDPRTKKVCSFYTMFSFSVENLYGDKEAFGDGLAFLISPDDHFLGSPGYLGLVDSANLTRKKFVAVEFDTKRDLMFQDPDDNHLGLDINSLFSIKLAKSSSLGVDLKSGNLIKAWIDYNSNENRLEVFLSYSYLKPKKPLLKVDIDLSDYLKDNMFVGFSAATEGSMQFIRIQQWEFTTTEFRPPSPPPPSPPESGRTFPNPSESGHKYSHLNWSAIGFIMGVCSFSFVVLFGWFYWKKLMGTIQKSEGTNNIDLHTIKPSGGMSCLEIQLSFLVDEITRGLNIDKVLDNEQEFIHVKKVKSNIPLCNTMPAVKPPLSNGMPLRTIDIISDR